MFYAVFYSQYFHLTHHLHTGLQLPILLLHSPIRKHQTILTHTIFNNHPFLAYILYYLNNFNQNCVILIIVK